MAENKKSFILYADLISTIDKLPDDIAGKLFKTIFEYVNDKNPIVTDLILQIAFEPIKLQLKRDLKEWEEIRQERIKSGHLGGIKSGESRRKKQTKQVLQKRSKTKQNEANEAVTVTVTVNDTVKKKREFLKEKVEKEKIIKPFTSEKFQVLWQNWKEYRLQEFKKKYKSGQSEQAALTHLAKISGDSENVAEEVINQSIANQWQGLFELKNIGYGTYSKNNGTGNKPGTSSARVAALKNWTIGGKIFDGT